MKMQFLYILSSILYFRHLEIVPTLLTGAYELIFYALVV